MAILTPALETRDIRGTLINDFERQRNNVLAMVEAVPPGGTTPQGYDLIPS